MEMKVNIAIRKADNNDRQTY